MCSRGNLKISIITATLNSEKHLEYTIRSVLLQNYSNIEYIIIDGGSIDGTLGLINKYVTNITRIVSEPDKGVYDAFNKGVSMATGDIIYFLNSDDYLYDSNVINNVAEIFLNDVVDLVYGNILVLDEPINWSYIHGKKIQLSDLQQGYMPPHPGIFIRKSLFEKYGLFDLKYKIAADFDLVVHYFKEIPNTRIFYTDQVIAVFRLGGLSSNEVTVHISRQEVQEIVKKHFGLPIENYSTEQDMSIFYKRWLEIILIHGHPISHQLYKAGIRKVAVLGTGKTVLCILEDLRQSDISIIAFLDNDTKKQGTKIRGIETHNPSWLQQNLDKLNAIIISIESEKNVTSAKDQLKLLLNNSNIPFYSWKELICSIGR
jgi:glycosyltransferase involved in cell wall biosynthesis